MNATFNIIGRLARINKFDNVTKITLATHYTKRVNDQWEDATRVNQVTIFGQSQRTYIDKMTIGDLLHVAGDLEDIKYEKDGEEVYTTNKVVTEISRLVKKQEG